MADKLDRAEKHIRDLKKRLHILNREYSDSVIFKDDPHTGDRTYKIVSIPPLDDEIALIAGDAIHNTRTALDHLAYRLVCVETGESGPFNDVYFPIGDTPEHYKARLGRIIERLRPDAIEAINAIQPYEGGRGHDLWCLHRLDIIDKHRLPLAVGSTNRFESMAPSVRAGYAKHFLSVSSLPSGSVMLTTPAFVHFPLQAGNTLRTVLKADIEEKVYFQFDVAFDEPGIFRGESVIVTIHQLHKRVRDILMCFESNGLLR